MTLTAKKLETLRSLLFVPAIEDRFIDKAHQRGAGAIILDLEDSIAPEKKLAARNAVGAAAMRLGAKGVTVLVRINHGSVADIEAAVSPCVSAIVLPKVNTAAEIHEVAAALESREKQLGIAEGHTRLLVLIETPAAVVNAFSISTAHERVSGLILGSEDLALELGVEPSPDSLSYAAAHLVMAARAAGKVPLGIPGSLATIANSEGFHEVVALARKLGMAGTVCIHPDQVAVVQCVYAPDPAAVSQARRILEVFHEAERTGKGAVSLDGKMLDLPIVERARRLVAEEDTFAGGRE
jgi:citrate lyase subunit beta/citryl-CoA lyase